MSFFQWYIQTISVGEMPSSSSCHFVGTRGGDINLGKTDEAENIVEILCAVCSLVNTDSKWSAHALARADRKVGPLGKSTHTDLQPVMVTFDGCVSSNADGSQHRGGRLLNVP